MTENELITQLSIFVNNEPGSLASIAKVLKECDINLKAFNIAESSGFGVLRAISDNPKKACASLRDRGIVVKPTKVIAVPAEDQPGGLFKIADALGEDGINIEYGYAYAGKKGPAIFIRVDDPETALVSIKKAGIGILREADL